MQRVNITVFSSTVKAEIGNLKFELKDIVCDVKRSLQQTQDTIRRAYALKVYISNTKTFIKQGKIVSDVQVDIAPFIQMVNELIKSLEHRLSVLSEVVGSELFMRPQSAPLRPLVGQGQRLCSNIIQLIMDYQDCDGKNYWLLSKKLCSSMSIRRKISFPVYMIKKPHHHYVFERNIMLKSLHLTGFINLFKTMQAVGHKSQCQTPQNCTCLPSIKLLHMNTGPVTAFQYCQQRITDIVTFFAHGGVHQGDVIDRKTDQATGAVIVQNLGVPDINKLKRRCGYIISARPDIDGFVFADDKAWVRHLVRYNVDIKVCVYEDCSTHHFSHKGIQFKMGINFFTGECMDQNNCVFRLKSDQQDNSFGFCSYTKGKSIHKVIVPGTDRLPKELVDFYTIQIKAKTCLACGKVYKTSHTACKAMR